MTVGSLTHLYSNENTIFCLNPQITYFKSVFRKYTKFVMTDYHHTSTDNNNSFSDIIIFDNQFINSHSTIIAQDGEFQSMHDGILLNLNDGSIHEKSTLNDEYRKTFFDNYKIAIPFDELGYNEKQKLQ